MALLIGVTHRPAPASIHNVSTSDAPGGKAIRCDGCGFKAEGFLFGAREAKRLAFAHVTYPDCTVLELLQGPPCEGRVA